MTEQIIPCSRSKSITLRASIKTYLYLTFTFTRTNCVRTLQIHICVCFPHKEPRSQTRTEFLCGMVPDSYLQQHYRAYSAAEYACPVWKRSTRARKLNPALHDCCLPNHLGRRCLKPTNLDSVHLLAGVAPPHTRRTFAAWNAHGKRQTSETNCSSTEEQIKVAEELHENSHAARYVCDQQQTAVLERQPDRRASLPQNMTRGGRVFACWIWRGLALLASPSSSIVYHRLIYQSVGAMLWSMAQLRRGQLRMVVDVVGSC